MWKKEVITAPTERLVVDLDQVLLSISRHKADRPDDVHNGDTWQYVMVSLGSFNKAPVESCKVTWPREAIALVRAELDKLEARLNEEDEHETCVRGRQVDGGAS